LFWSRKIQALRRAFNVENEMNDERKHLGYPNRERPPLFTISREYVDRLTKHPQV